MFRLFPCLGYCKHCCNEHRVACIFLNYSFVQIHAQEWECWIIWHWVTVYLVVYLWMGPLKTTLPDPSTFLDHSPTAFPIPSPTVHQTLPLESPADSEGRWLPLSVPREWLGKMSMNVSVNYSAESHSNPPAHPLSKGPLSRSLPKVSGKTLSREWQKQESAFTMLQLPLSLPRQKM